MFLNRKQKGFGWYTKVDRKDIGLEKPYYINFSFKKGCDPIEGELNDAGSMKCDLILKTAKGYRQVFPVVNEYNGNTYLEYKILDLTDEPKPFMPRNEEAKPFGQLNVEPDDLPFY